jgi:uncharacterized membrane protein
MGAYWMASVLNFSIKIYREFPEFYKFILHRMRLYSSVRWIFQWSFGCIVLAAFLYFILGSYDYNVREAINSYSIKPLLAAYGASLFFAIFIYILICNIIAETRGTRCSRL